MIYLKVQENEYPAYISGRLIDRPSRQLSKSF